MPIPNDAVGPLSEAAKDLVPRVYEDTLHGAAQEIGKSLAGVVRTALRPVNALVWTVDHAADWLQTRVSQLLERRGVGTESISSPSPQLLYGVIRGVQATGEEPDSDLRDMYAALLATAMDRNSVPTAHPAFAELLHQMVSDEAKIVRILGLKGGKRVLVKCSVDAAMVGGSPATVVSRFSEVVDSLDSEAGCIHSAMIPSYIDNLKRLGLVVEEELLTRELPKDFLHNPSDSMGAWFLEYDGDEVSALKKRLGEFRLEFPDSALSVVVKGTALNLTSFGSQFVAACVVNQLPA